MYAIRSYYDFRIPIIGHFEINNRGGFLRRSADIVFDTAGDGFTEYNLSGKNLMILQRQVLQRMCVWEMSQIMQKCSAEEGFNTFKSQSYNFV